MKKILFTCISKMLRSLCASRFVFGMIYLWPTISEFTYIYIYVCLPTEFMCKTCVQVPLEERTGHRIPGVREPTPGALQEQ